MVGFSLMDLWSSFDTDIVGYILFFFIIFAFMTVILRKTFFKDQNGILIVISATSSLLAIWGLMRNGFSISELFFKLNLPPELQYNLIWILFLMVFLFLWVKWGLGICFLILGSFLIIVGAMELIYAKTLAIIVGICLIVLGVILWRIRIRKGLSFRTGRKIINFSIVMFLIGLIT